MHKGCMTEYEWRQRYIAAKRQPDWVGPQYFEPFRRKKQLKRKVFRCFLILSLLFIAFGMPVFFPVAHQETFDEFTLTGETPIRVRNVKTIHYQLPKEMHYQHQIFARTQLLTGKILLIDEQHPLPDDMLPPNTAAIAKKGNGMIPVRSLEIRSGYETIEALGALFQQLRSLNIQGIYVSKGIMSQAQQREQINQYMRELMRKTDIQHAVSTARQMMDIPGAGSMLLEYTVEIDSSGEKSLDTFPQGQAFLQLCWRYGFVQESDQRPNRFRYVGKAHATAMTYLDLDLESYLEWMHQKGGLVVMAGDRPQYLILCKPMQGGYAAFDLPVGAAYEVSMDNTGYALAACIL